MLVAPSRLGLVALLLLSGCGSSGGDEGDQSSFETGGAAGARATGGTDATGGAGTGGAESTGGAHTTGGAESTGGAHTTGGSVAMGGSAGSDSACNEGTTRAGSTSCGLNDRGAFEEVCEDGSWAISTTCDDPDECADSQSRNSETECGTNGVLVELCNDGQWMATSECNETPECSGNGTSAGTTSCGLNGRGKLDQACQGGFWHDTENCVDPDECTDGDTQAIATCSNGSGVLEQTCLSGAWEATECALSSIDRASVSSAGAEGSGMSDDPSISADGRYVAFRSEANNLVSGDTNFIADIFVHDLVTGDTSRVNVSDNGTESNLYSYNPVISADGHFVAFESAATNLVSGDTNVRQDIFVRDIETGTTSRVSLASDGTQSNGNSFFPILSADGRYAAFMSTASNLVNGDANGTEDVFVHDRVTGTTSLVSVHSTGAQANFTSTEPSISADGRYVAFSSPATTLVSNDTNVSEDVFVHDAVTGSTTRVSLASNGGQANGQSNQPSISADGRYVAFRSDASNLATGDTNGVQDIFVHDRVTGVTTCVSVNGAGTQGAGVSSAPSISGDGRYVSFTSASSNLVTGDTNGVQDIFVHDRVTGKTTRVSQSSAGTQGNGYSHFSSLSFDGASVVFQSASSNLVSGDGNGDGDIFVSPVTWMP